MNLQETSFPEAVKKQLTIAIDDYTSTYFSIYIIFIIGIFE